MAGLLIIDDHAILSQALAQALRLDGFEPVEVADDLAPKAVLSHAARMQPAAALLDLHLNDDVLGTPFIAPLRRAGTRVVVLTASRERLLLGEALDQGADAVIDKALPYHELIEVLRNVLAGRPVTMPGDRDELVMTYRRALADGDPYLALTRLTPREQQVLAGLVDGLAPKDIARALGVAVPTVRTQVRTLFTKLNVNSQRAAVATALHAGFDPQSHRVW